MDWMTPELLKQLIGSVFMAGAVYAGIRADIKGLHTEVKQAMSTATRAHDRIDSHLDKGQV